MTGNESLPAGMELRREPEGLVLVADGMSLRADFSRLLPRLELRRLGRERAEIGRASCRERV